MIVIFLLKFLVIKYMNPQQFYFFNKIINPETAGKFRKNDVYLDDKEKRMKNKMENEYRRYKKKIEKEKKAEERKRILMKQIEQQKILKGHGLLNFGNLDVANVVNSQSFKKKKRKK